MKVYFLTIAFFICTTQMFYSQEEDGDGVVALSLPVRNSLRFNRYAINPTFSFVREQNKYISLTNKREWVQFEDAPQTYLFSYSGRFAENIGAGVGLFQQNYGVLTTFGGVLNFAYNARLDRDSNLTFGINLGAYKSGVNSGNVVTNFPDPSLDDIPSNFLLTVNPGINYGTAFMDFGVSINNLVLYNINSSQLIEDNPEQSIQGHIMYTGYMSSAGFFDESRFSGLVRSEFKKEKTVLSAVAMLMVPKGIWAQVGYNNLYGASGGIGLNITKELAIEYNFEKALGDLTDFGPSHEITLAYKFNNRQNYDYSREDDVSGLISGDKKRKPVSQASKLEADNNRKLAEAAKAEAKLLAEAKLKAEEEAKAQQEAENKAKAEEKAKADAEASRLAKEAQLKLDQEAKIKADEDAKAKLEEERIAKEVAAAKAKIAAENKAKAEAEAKAKQAEEAKAKAEQARLEEMARIEAENKAKAKLEAEAKAQADEEARLKADAEAKAQLEEKIRLEAENKARLEAEAIAKAEEQERLEAEAEAQAQREAQARLEAEIKAKEEEAAKAKLEEESKENQPLQPTDDIAKSMVSIEKLTEDSKKEQEDLLSRFTEAVASKNRDLKDLKEENDLSDQGIYMEPKPFKSLTEENNAIEALKVDIDEIINTRNERIKELEDLYEERLKIATIENDTVNLYYQRAIKKLKAEQLTAIQTKANLTSSLQDINEATEIERKRRIKRAAYDNEQDRFVQDKARLSIIRQNTPLSTQPLKSEDFDFGEEQSDNIQILKNVKNVENGYYMIVAVHNDVDKRDEFLTKAVASGRTDIDFFYDVNTSKYYIYYQKFENIEEANDALKSKGSRPYNGKLSIVKIEN